MKTIKYKSLNQHKVSKRTGKNTVALVGFAQTTRDMTPWDDPDTEIWGLNEAYHVSDFMKRWDRWFQMHSRLNFSRPDNPHDPDHYKWLKESKGFPIYMQHRYYGIPSSVEYPLNDVVEMIGHRYLTSTVSFMLGLAMLEGFERIELYGIEMGSDTEYAYQRPNGEFMIGFALAKGHEVYLPPQCGLLTGQLYGYEKIGVGFRQQLEIRSNLLKTDKKTAVQTMHQCEGGVIILDQKLAVPDFDFSREGITKLRDELKLEYPNHVGLVRSIGGQQAELAAIMALYDGYPFETDMGEGQDVEQLEKDNSK